MGYLIVPLFFHIMKGVNDLDSLSINLELDAVNEMLSSIGEGAVNSLENLTDADAINARSILQRVNRQFQSRGWSFNSQEGYTFNADATTHKILWNNDILYVEGNNNEKLIKRGLYMFDMASSTYKFNNSITADVIMLVSFDDMPEQARAYIVAKSCTEFATRFVGDTALTSVLIKREQEAWQYFHEYEMDNNDYNMLANSDVQAVTQ